MIGQKRVIYLTETEEDLKDDPFQALKRPMKRQRVQSMFPPLNCPETRFISKREGGLAAGDTPLYLKSCVVIEGDLFWKVVWQSSKQTTLLDSFES
jgi:hypothetical protein